MGYDEPVPTMCEAASTSHTVEFHGLAPSLQATVQQASNVCTDAKCGSCTMTYAPEDHNQSPRRDTGGNCIGNKMNWRMALLIRYPVLDKLAMLQIARWPRPPRLNLHHSPMHTRPRQLRIRQSRLRANFQRRKPSNRFQNPPAL